MYSRIISILDENFEERWFLDSGSLLGVIRDGKFLKQDKGIDISVLVDNYHSPIFEKCIRQFQKEGFVVSRYQWDGTTYKYCLAPKRNNLIKYAIDLHLFKRVGDNYLCPQMKIERSGGKIIGLMRGIRKGNMYVKKKGVIGSLQSFFLILYRDYFEYFGRPMNMNKLTSGKAENLYKWFFPVKLFKGVKRERCYGFNVLADCDDYLSLRYGNWHVPVSDWVTLRDDGGISHSNKNEITELLR